MLVEELVVVEVVVVVVVLVVVPPPAAGSNHSPKAFRSVAEPVLFTHCPKGYSSVAILRY